MMKTHDGATLLATIEGRSDRDHDNPANARIHSSKTYETCDERFKWMNNQVLGKPFCCCRKIYILMVRYTILINVLSSWPREEGGPQNCDKLLSNCLDTDSDNEVGTDGKNESA